MITSALALVSSLAVARTALHPQAAPAANPASDVPWPARIGMRTVEIEASRPIAPQVTLVPDAATYLDEIGRWTQDARWPVLFEDDRYAPQFIRAFKPERIVRRESVGPLPERAALVATIESIARKASADRAAAPCAVVTSVDDPAWVGAVALVAGRGAPVAFLDGDFGRPNDVLGAAEFAKLDAGLKVAVDGITPSWRGLGDAIDAIALCRSLPAKATPDLPDAQRPPLPANAPVKLSDPCATTDVLARTPTGERSAVVGWLFGDYARSAYMAMSSMFAPRKDVQFISGYGTTEPWSAYDPTRAATLMGEQGFQVSVHTGEQATLGAWEKLLMGGFGSDVLIMNSSGDPDIFNLTNTQVAAVGDVPFFDGPVAVHLIHSWSLNRPDDRQTVGGRLLERGAYAYVGSVQEPFLMAFVPPAALVPRLLGLGPFLVSGRVLEGPFDRVWRVTLIGDPLCTLYPPQLPAIPKAPLPPMNGADVLGEAKEFMKQFASNGDPQAAAAAMKRLVVAGRDDIAVQFFAAARERNAAKAVAPQSLGPLFRARAFSDFLAAFRLCDAPRSDDIDMLWHLAGPRAAMLDSETLLYLREKVRRPDVSRDLRRLLPGIDKTLGRRTSDRIVQEELDRTTDPAIRGRLSELLRR